MWIVRTVIIAILLILVVAFAYSNSGPNQKVDVNLAPLLPNYVDVPLVTVVFWAFAAGVILALVLFVTMYIKQAVDVHQYRRRVKTLESEVAILRNRPIEESAELLRGGDSARPTIPSPFSEI